MTLDPIPNPNPIPSPNPSHNPNHIALALTRSHPTTHPAPFTPVTMERTGKALTLRKEELQVQIKGTAVGSEERLSLEDELREVETRLGAGGAA